MSSDALAPYRRLTIKIGSALLVDGKTGRLRADWLASLAADLAALKAKGVSLVIVSSGAIALGRRLLGLDAKVLPLEQSQAAASAGQIALSQAWATALGAHEIVTGQILLTPNITEERRYFLNARTTISTLLGLGAVPMQDMDAALFELDFLINKLKFSGVEIASHINGTSIGDPRFEPFFAAAERMGAAIFVHALRPAGQDRIVGAFTEQAVCFPGDIGLACASMITGGIGARHPKLRIAFSHGGGVMAMLLPRLVHAWNKFPKARESLTEAPEVTAKRFYYDELVFDPASVRFLIERFGVSQIVIGTDYPFTLGDFTPMKSISHLDKSTIAAITSVNARRFLGLPAAAR